MHRAADLDLARIDNGKWFRWFSDPVYGRGYPSDMVEHFSNLGAFPNGMNFVQTGDMSAIAVPTDFIGLNYYDRTLARADVPDNDPQIDFPLPKTPENWTEMGWENYPDGLTGVLCRVYFDYLPRKIYITENGASYSTGPDENGNVPDVNRTNYLKSHLRRRIARCRQVCHWRDTLSGR
ncbi:MAG: family 1 glycosylhydrolase [Anaerolineales bacterium]|nr:family 1 glycosylhydrolase [Anaerolineales bacterium]